MGVGRDWLNWYIPIVLIFLAYRFTKSYPQQVRAQQAQGQAATDPATRRA